MSTDYRKLSIKEEIIESTTVSKCIHCGNKAGHGTHKGCYSCGKVKDTVDGKRKRK
jgi:hypothetical protein